MVTVLKSAARKVLKHWKLISLTALKFMAQRHDSAFEERLQQTIRNIAVSILDLQGM